MTATKESLVRDLRVIGIEGRHVMVHSSYKALGPVEGGPQAVVDAFVEAVGNGALLFPTFDFQSFSERGYWDRRDSPSRMGIISEMARQDYRSYRTAHPMLSFATYGYRNLHPDGSFDFDTMFQWRGDCICAHGSWSIFEGIYSNDGLLIDFSPKGIRPNDRGYTMAVQAAVLAESPWRFVKTFEGTYVDDEGVSIRKYSASVSRRDRYVTEVEPGHRRAIELGVIRQAKLGAFEDVWVSDARAFLDFAIESHQKEPELWRRELPTNQVSYAERNRSAGAFIE